MMLNEESKDIHWDILSYVQFINMTGFTYLLYLSMTYITLDRLLGTLLHIRYRRYFDHKKAIWLSVWTWCINIVISVGVSVVCFAQGIDSMYQPEDNFAANISGIDAILTNESMEDLEHGHLTYPADIILDHIPSLLDVTFATFAITTYVIIFVKYASSRREVCSDARQDSMFTIFRKSRFHTSIFLITSFLVLTVIPGLINSILHMSGHIRPESFVLYFTVSLHLSLTSNALIYIFLQGSVRKLLLEKLQVWTTTIWNHTDSTYIQPGKNDSNRDAVSFMMEKSLK